jgi:hypothetical protein
MSCGEGFLLSLEEKFFFFKGFLESVKYTDIKIKFNQKPIAKIKSNL